MRSIALTHYSGLAGFTLATLGSLLWVHHRTRAPVQDSPPTECNPSVASAASEPILEHHQDLVAVNFHFTRKCNYNCGFCFHTAKTSHLESKDNLFKILHDLREYGCRKINFAGGEPFMYPELLGDMVQYCKEVLKYESVSIISNASKIQERWFATYGQYIDILGVSCDAVEDDVNKSIGRGGGNHTKFVHRAAAICRLYNIPFKLNTVVNAYNVDKDLGTLVNELQPMRWKVFQVLGLTGENTGEDSLRDVSRFLISDEKFQSYIERNRKQLQNPEILKVEDNSTMQSSYILVDEYGCFLDCSGGGKVATRSILDVGVRTAFHELLQSSGGGFDRDAFIRRDGDYASSSWSRERMQQMQQMQPPVPNRCVGGGGCGSGRERPTIDIEDLLTR